MDIGKFRDRVYILKTSHTSDNQGGRSTSWVDLVTGTTTLTTFWAAINSVSGRETLAATQISATITYLVTMRYRADIDETMRVQWQPYQATAAKTFEIHGVLLDAARVIVTLQCSEA